MIQLVTCRELKTICQRLVIYRNFCKSVKETVKYTNTINLPKTKFPQRLSAQKRSELENNIRQKSLASLYSWQQEHLDDPEFILHDGPPYANGDLHMGHAVNKILKDIILKEKIIDQQKVNYVPGWDCHGLPIELKVLTDHRNFTPIQIRKKARKFALETVEKQKKSFESWGVTGNWDYVEDTYRTLDKNYIKNQNNIFLQLYKSGLIYKDLKPVFWSPSSGTALAESELEYDDNFISNSLYFRCKIKNPEVLGRSEDIYSLVWTTTPWTLPANQAICYNKNLYYGLVKISDCPGLYILGLDAIENLEFELDKDIEIVEAVNTNSLSSLEYFHPINKNEVLPCIGADHVQADKGTGLVHTAPSHGPDDFLVFLGRKVPLKSLVNEKGQFNQNAPEFLRDKEVLTEGNQLVIDYMADNVVTLKKLKHSYPIDWRTKNPVIIVASEQWFINTEKIKNKAIDELASVEIYPRNTSQINKNVLITQLEKRPYWCISRQRSWGVPIPVFYKPDNTPVVTDAIIQHLNQKIEENDGVDFWWTESVDQLLPQEILKDLNLNVKDLRKGTDILDIWFDSGISWSSVLKDQQVADLYLEGIDQFTGWFQSSLMTSVALRGKSPYKALFVHGFTVDEKGLKMSKSTGNVISPEDIIKKYGIDTMRWWIAAHATQHVSIPVSAKLLEDSHNNVLKVRATLKYLLGVFENYEFTSDMEIDEEQLRHLDKYILHNLTVFTQFSADHYDNYQFNRIVALLNNFVNTELSSIYLHLIKDRLYCDTDEEHKRLVTILKPLYLGLCKVLWPITPFLVEESWSYLNKNSFYENTKIQTYKRQFHESEELVLTALDVRRTLGALIKDINSWKLNVKIETNADNLKELMKLHPMLKQPLIDTELCEILQVSSVELIKGTNDDYKISFTEIDSELCPRCRRFASKSGICERCQTVLLSKVEPVKIVN